METARSLAGMGASIVFATRNEEKTAACIKEVRKDASKPEVRWE